MNSADDLFMKRALQLASYGRTGAHPNPMVGAVVVHDGIIIGEGYHKKYGEAHAEVNAINSVVDKNLLHKSKIYVTLEPCSHFGKTPPCADLIVRCGIPEVIIGTKDPFSKVDGTGIRRLRDAGIKVRVGVLENECKALNAAFFTAHTLHRPYITLKWAESKDGYLGQIKDGRVAPYQFSTAASKLAVYKLRAENDAIMVGARTVIADNPRLDVRYIPGRNPIKVVVDRHGEIPAQSNVFQSGKTLYFVKETRSDLPADVVQISDCDSSDLEWVMSRLYAEGITSLLVEGGPTLLNRLIEKRLYDRVRVEKSDIVLGDKGYGVVKGF